MACLRKKKYIKDHIKESENKIQSLGPKGSPGVRLHTNLVPHGPPCTLTKSGSYISFHVLSSQFEERKSV